jgi:tRNA G37 N-methylase TrmD
VPDVLLSGDHRRIAEWREQQGDRLTAERANLASNRRDH